MAHRFLRCVGSSRFHGVYVQDLKKGQCNGRPTYRKVGGGDETLSYEGYEGGREGAI
eukprot:COSAG02_NODE_6994_length_3237_cov_2.412046_2_plen_57_part_00